MRAFFISYRLLAACLSMLIFLCFVLFPPFPTAGKEETAETKDLSAHRLATRREIPEPYKWKISDIYPDRKRWEEDYRNVQRMIRQIQRYAGRTGNSPRELANVFTLQTEMSKKLERVYAYAHLQLDLNNRDPEYQELAARADRLAAQAAQGTAFIVPEILQIPQKRLEEYLRHPSLQPFAKPVRNILRKKTNIRSHEVEEVLAGTEEFATAPEEAYSMLLQADMRFPELEHVGGKLQLTPANLLHLLKSEDRSVRKRAFQAFYETLEQYENTMATLLAAEVKKNNFYAKERRYRSALEASLATANIPVNVYDQLLAVVHRHLPLLHRYVALKKKWLGLDELHMYDLYAEIGETDRKKIPYDKAVEIVKAGLAPLGNEYGNIVSRGLRSRWVDVYTTPGKSNGAYNWGIYGVHPFILLNYQGALDDVFTLAHELGHAIHSYLSAREQPYQLAKYDIFVAEVASTLNEALLLEQLLERAGTEEEKIRLLHYSLEQFRGTLFRQTMFAEFEKIIHQKAAAGEALHARTLKDIYYRLNKKYYGPGIVVDKEIAIEWARVPHFYRNFYVYQYATGFAAANAIAKQIREEGPVAVERYLRFLRAGGSQDPLELLRSAGVDLTSTQPLEAAMDVFRERLERLEQLLAAREGR
ncbi:oligoendopeptidase F [Bacillaceae bacterium]